MLIILSTKKANEEHDKFYCMESQLEKKILRKHKVKVTSHHGEDLERNSVRMLMEKEDEICKEMSDCFCELNDSNKTVHENYSAANEEFRTTRKDYGDLFCLLDNFFQC